MGYNTDLIPLVMIVYIIFQEDNQQTFNFMVNYISSKNLKALYIKQAYDFKLKNYILNILIKDFHPDIYYHLTKKL